jgi:hypothetical protein
MQAVLPDMDQATRTPSDYSEARTATKPASTSQSAGAEPRVTASAAVSRATAQAAQASGPTTPDRAARLVSHPVIVTPSSAAADGGGGHAHASPADNGAAAATGSLLAIDDEYETVMSMLAD